MNSENPYQTINQRVVYQNQWMTLREDQIVHPNGDPGTYSVLELPGFAGVVPIDADGGVYLVRLWRYPIGQWSWEIPGGRIDPNEAAEVSAHRELLEETGLRAAELIELGQYYALSGVSNDKSTIFLARQLSRVSDQVDDEVQHLQKLSLAKILSMIDSGEINNGQTMAAIFKVCRYLEAHP